MVHRRRWSLYVMVVCRNIGRGRLEAALESSSESIQCSCLGAKEGMPAEEESTLNSAGSVVDPSSNQTSWTGGSSMDMTKLT